MLMYAVEAGRRIGPCSRKLGHVYQGPPTFAQSHAETAAAIPTATSATKTERRNRMSTFMGGALFGRSS